MSEPALRDEAPGDAAAVRGVLEAAFGGAEEVRLVERLRGEPGVLAFVALEGDELVGHLLLSPAEPETPAPGLRVLALAPLAVRPDRQRRGIGTALVRHGLAAARAAGADLVVLLGHPGYYRRFGFVPGARHGMRCRWSDGPEFQVLELVPGRAALARGTVRYHRAFDAL